MAASYRASGSGSIVTAAAYFARRPRTLADLTHVAPGALRAYSSIPDMEKTGLVRMSAGSMRMRSSLLRLSSGSEASR